MYIVPVHRPQQICLPWCDPRPAVAPVLEPLARWAFESRQADQRASLTLCGGLPDGRDGGR